MAVFLNCVGLAAVLVRLDLWSWAAMMAYANCNRLRHGAKWWVRARRGFGGYAMGVMEHVRQDEILTVNLAGKLAGKVYADLEVILDDWSRDGGLNTLIDFERVTFVKSDGLRLLWRHANHATLNGGRLVLVAVHDAIFQVFDVNELSGLFKFVDSIAEAKEHLRAVELGMVATA